MVRIHLRFSRARGCALNRAFAVGWAVFALLFFTLGFHPGVVRSDDFGYLHSVLGTLERGRPYVYDWLAPLGAFYSSACALLYLATGDFLLSTWGFQALCVLALYPLLYKLIAARLSQGHSAVLALALASFPIFFAKEADFHAGICTLDLFLLSLILYEKGRLGWFFFTAFLAFANRQNHIVLLLLPAWAAVRILRAGSVPKALIAGILAFIAAVAALMFSMNRSYAAINAGFPQGEPLRLLSVAAVTLAAGGFLTLGWLGAVSFLAGRRPGWGTGIRRWALPLAASLALMALVPFWHDTLLFVDTSMFALVGWPQVNRALPWLILPALWLLDYRLLRPSPYSALITAYFSIAASRGILWDYYFMEISILCLLMGLQSRTEGSSGVTMDPVSSGAVQKPALLRAAQPAQLPHPSHPPHPPHPSHLRTSVLAVLALVLAGNLAYAYLLKVQSDKQAVSVRVLERLEREGRVTVDAMTGSTFGYAGWKLFDWFIANDGRVFGDLAGFMGYVRRDRVVIESGLPWRSAFKGPLPASAFLLDSGWCRVGFAQVRYRVADLRGPDSTRAAMGRTLTLDNTRYRAPRFPLDGQEWRALADSVLGRR